jgi:hypothetical protein
VLTRFIFCAATCVLSLPCMNQAAAASLKFQDLPASGLKFSSYPARRIFRGKPARVVLDTPQARKFRTRLREDSRLGPNFAGHYTVVFWGCGTGCAQLAVVNAHTGKVIWLPQEWIDIPDAPDAKPNRNFQIDSKLLIVTKSNYDAHATFTAFYYVVDNDRLRLIKKAYVDNATQ